MIQVGIIGGAGFTAGELIRILLNHPDTNIDFIFSTSNAGNSISNVHTDLFGESDLSFTNTLNANVDVVFLCLGHGNSREFLSKNSFSNNTKIIDLSNDFRLTNDKIFDGREFVYGLPELDKNSIKNAKNIANPGCFATAIQLGILPMANAKALQNEIHISAITGSTGAGQSLSKTTHFSWRNNNISSYKMFTHQHLGEINQNIKQLQNNFDFDINFVPLRGDFSRGIFATIYTETTLSERECIDIYTKYYKNHPFVHISTKPIDLKQVINTNKCILHLQKHNSKIIITSVIDNLIKGASGAAVQNMNLMFGLDEKKGLNLKSIAF